MDYMVVLMKGATRENQHVEVCGVYMREQNYMLTFLCCHCTCFCMLKRAMAA